MQSMKPLRHGMGKALLPLATLAVFALAHSTAAQVIVNERFDYLDTAAMSANWQMGTAALSLSTANGNPAPSAFHPGTSTSPNIWIGSTFSLTPGDAQPVRLTADIWSAGNPQSSDTVGLRQSGGFEPLFEMGMYRSFDNVQTGPSNVAAISPAQDGIGVRTINIGVDLNAQDWVKMSPNYVGWARWQATFTASNVVTRVDLGIDGTWDLAYTEIGTNSIAPFSELRIHSPALGTGGGFMVDNILLEVVPLDPVMLEVSLSGGAPSLCWPSNAAAFVLEYADHLTPPVDWQPLTNNIAVNGSKWCYTETNSTVLARFYRLAKP